MVATIIVVLIIILAAGLALRSLMRDKKSGKTCSGCNGNCHCSDCHGE